MTPAALLSAALRLAPAHDEPEADRLARFATIAVAVSEQPMPADVLAAMIQETGLSPSAHRGEQRGDRGRSWCVAQLNEGNPLVADHASTAGTGLDATRRCAAGAARTLVRARGWCAARGYRGRAAAHALYATGKRCTWSDATSRARLADRIDRWGGSLDDQQRAALERVIAPAEPECAPEVVIRLGRWTISRVDARCDEREARR